MSRVKTVPPGEIESLGIEIQRFEEISARTRRRFERLGLEPHEVERAVRWARESS